MCEKNLVNVVETLLKKYLSQKISISIKMRTNRYKV